MAETNPRANPSPADIFGRYKYQSSENVRLCARCAEANPSLAHIVGLYFQSAEADEKFCLSSHRDDWWSKFQLAHTKGYLEVEKDPVAKHDDMITLTLKDESFNIVNHGSPRKMILNQLSTDTLDNKVTVYATMENEKILSLRFSIHGFIRMVNYKFDNDKMSAYFANMEDNYSSLQGHNAPISDKFTAKVHFLKDPETDSCES